MRMSPELHKKIKKALNEFINTHPVEVKKHIEAVFESQSFANFRHRITWDLYWAVNNLYKDLQISNAVFEEGLLDSHINTSLTRIVRENPFVNDLIKKFES